MENKTLAWLSSQVGKPLREGPSPLGRWLDGTLTAVSDTSLTATFLVRPDMCNPMGTLHGGVAASMMDDLLGAAVFAISDGGVYASVNLNVDYLEAVPHGQTVKVRTELIRSGSRIMHLNCYLYDAAGKLAAKAASNLMRIQPKTA